MSPSASTLKGTSMRLSALFALVLGPAVLACTDQPPESAGPEDQGVPQWQLEPKSQIGSLDDPSQSLTRVVQVLIGPDGELIVSQPLDRRVLVYDTDGQLTREIGRSGEGPGEFGGVGNMGLLSDTLYVGDNGLGRLNFFTLAGEFLNSVRWTSPRIRDGRVGYMETAPQVVLPDGSALLEPGMVMGMMRGETGPTTSTHRTLFLRIAQNAEGADTAALIDAEYRSTTVTVEGMTQRISCPFDDYPLGELMLEGSGVVIVHRPVASGIQPSDFGILIVDPRGDTTVSRSIEYNPIPLPETSVEEAIAQVRSQRLDRDQPAPTAGQVRSAWAQIDCSLLALPPVTELVPTQDGLIWLRREAVPEDSVAWSVVDRLGQIVGQVSLPSDEAVVASRGETLVTLRLDEFDVPYLRRYGILR
jgi:hypothetical protein